MYKQILILLIITVSFINARPCCLPSCDPCSRVNSCCPNRGNNPCTQNNSGTGGTIDIQDPCEDTNCPDGYKCEDGSCLICGPDEECKSCEKVYCPLYFKCRSGVCVPDESCKDVLCPNNSYCKDGKCIRVK
ncbi:spore coat protein SP87-like [Ctenocephalides felis]|uniref:spore coat protein SP87-like n=1 Tax=Ctenocephalides felis TaxID=7515 RepID=UPI000E6E3695|nr:spore coat protein SP87-like [Ctenocephalides felis]